MGIDLAVTGNTGINLLNANGVGLFEMNFDLENGVSSKIGMGGYDMSAATILSAINGMSTYKTSRDILNQGFSGDRAAAMRMLASYAADETDERFEQLMNGQAEFTIEEGAGNAKTEQDENGRINMRIDSQEGTNGDLLTGIALIHEAFRNGLDDGETGQQQENAESVIHHTIAAQMVGQGYGMSSLSDSLKDEIKILNSEGGIQKLAEHAVENYDWSADYWKLVTDEHGNLAWEDDHSTDFDLSLLAMGTVAAEDMDTTMKYNILSRFGKVSNWDEYRSDPENFNPLAAVGYDNMISFVNGTDSFIDASLAAEAFMASQTRDGLNAVNRSLMDIQASGLLVQSDVNIDTQGLIGEGTDEIPYAAARAHDDGTIDVTGFADFRFVNDEFYNDLQYSEVQNGDKSQEWLDSNYPLHQFAANQHAGGDLVGSGDVVSQVAGTLTMGFDDIYGLNAFTQSASNPGTGYFSGHLSGEGIMDYISLFATEGTNLQNNNGSYSLTGVQAGMVVGQQGSTGIATGDHIHNEIRQVDPITGAWNADPRAWNRFFRDSEAYNANLQGNEWANSYSGYRSDTDYSDPRLWSSTHNDWYSNGRDSMNYPSFFLEHLQDMPSSDYSLSWDELMSSIEGGW
ncbi:hypothetical protein L21SP2_0970 [Salinispira pacifica]|uniref:Uncharacterized protein n=2 Tax=Salinispira pacifica TaxID=1307761 RepID=V5WFG8_9SPIO|nr:hypothetical protein L21SP2_0970 [Salinispira pacifica]